jgi:hypothetical protein
MVLLEQMLQQVLVVAGLTILILSVEAGMAGLDKPMVILIPQHQVVVVVPSVVVVVDLLVEVQMSVAVIAVEAATEQ